MSRIYAVINRKGGVGKTTCAVNIGVSLAAAGKRVLLLDLDPQGNATTTLGIEKNDHKSVYDFLMGTKTLSEVVVEVYPPSFHFIKADNDLVGAEIELVGCKGRERYLQRALDSVKDYEFILMDCPPSLGLLTVNALVASDAVLVPLQCEFFSMEGFIQTRDTIRRINKNFNKKIDIEMIIFNMFDGSEEKEAFMREFKVHLDGHTHTRIVHRDNQFGVAPSHLKPGVCFNPWCKTTTQFQDIAMDLMASIRGGKS